MYTDCVNSTAIYTILGKKVHFTVFVCSQRPLVVFSHNRCQFNRQRLHYRCNLLLLWETGKRQCGNSSTINIIFYLNFLNMMMLLNRKDLL